MWEKEKLLVMSNFSFSHSVFKRLVSQGRQKVSLCGNGLNQLYGMSHALWKGDLMHLPKGIDPYQPAQSAPSSQAKMSLRRLTVMLPLNFLHVNPFQNCILDPSKLRDFKDDNFNFDEKDRSSPKGKKMLLEKQKLLITSNSSFYHSVFKRLIPQTRKNQGLFW